MVKCPKCGCDNPEGTPICRECGAPLSMSPAGQPVDEATATDQAVSEEDADVLELLQGGQKISAIKAYRERHGVGLKEAKDAVEALAKEHGIASQATGCAGMILLAVAGCITGAWYLLA